MNITCLEQGSRTLARLATRGRLPRFVQMAFTLGLLLYLGFQLTELGCQALWRSLPGTPWFYLVFMALYLVLPCCEGMVYGLLWGLPLSRGFPVLLKKRAYSQCLLDYSGEVYLYAWACRHLQLPPGRLLSTLKDNVVLSSLFSLGMAGALLLSFAVTGQVRLPWALESARSLWLGGFLLGMVILGALCLRFWRQVLSLSPRQAAGVAGLHAVRLLGAAALQVALWKVGDPSVPLQAWLILLSVQLLIHRVPFLPSRDLLFLGAGLELAAWMQMAQVSLAGLLLVTSALDKVLHLLVLLAGTRLARFSLVARHPASGGQAGIAVPA
jgi:hypothetical protein